MPRADLDVIMVAPKGPRPHRALRPILKGGGVPSLIAVHQDTPARPDIALSVCRGQRRHQRGVIETNFREETETDLFGEQAVLCGGAVELVQDGRDPDRRAGYAPRWPTSSACTS